MRYGDGYCGLVIPPTRTLRTAAATAQENKDDRDCSLVRLPTRTLHTAAATAQENEDSTEMSDAAYEYATRCGYDGMRERRQHRDE